VGSTVEFVVPDPASPAPRVDGTAVELVELIDVTGSGRREFEVRAITLGTAIVAARPPAHWSISFHVRN
jgi:hypothetical protein